MSDTEPVQPKLEPEIEDQIFEQADKLHDAIAPMLADVPIQVREAVIMMLHEDLAEDEAAEVVRERNADPAPEPPDISGLVMCDHCGRLMHRCEQRWKRFGFLCEWCDGRGEDNL